ncbi:MAG: glutathione peroxidase [Cryobacterium sp.]|nr:glutathione peroxidase [Oligoflexia bacterium]
MTVNPIESASGATVIESASGATVADSASGGKVGSKVSEKVAANKTATSVYDFEVKRINVPGSKDPQATALSSYRGKVLLIVNTASECGYTKQYKGLQELYTKHQKAGLEVLGFPANNFGAQEPGSNAEIKQFCERTFKVSFPLFEKASVKGSDIQPLYKYLTENAPAKGDVSWNFEKFLIGRDGKIIGRYLSKVEPDSPELEAAISKALATK